MPIEATHFPGSPAVIVLSAMRLTKADGADTNGNQELYLFDAEDEVMKAKLSDYMRKMASIFYDSELSPLIRETLKTASAIVEQRLVSLALDR